MRVLVDADACPVIKIVEQTAAKYKIPVTLFCDTSHVLNSGYSEIIVIGAGVDAVDFALINQCKEGDIVVTQDYGVAAMALGKKSCAIHQSGKWYTDENIDAMLMERHMKKEIRRNGKRNHLKGPAKRTAADDDRFLMSFERLIEELIRKREETRNE